MFDARSILDAIVAGSSEQTRGARESGGLKDIMGDILGQMQEGGGDHDQRRSLDRGAGQSGGGARPRNPLDDLFGQRGGGGDLQREAPRDDNGQSSYGEGTGEGAPDYGDMLERVKDLVANNKLAAGAIVGGLGGLLLGTKTGRSLAGRAARLGGLAVIGTLAYKAYKNYQQGQQVDDSRPFDMPELPQIPPPGSGFETEALGNDEAALFIRTMVAAAASDGQIDRSEQQNILKNLEQAGLQDEAMEFLADEFNNPASVDDIVAQVRNGEQAAQVYTAARIAIEPDTRDEQEFLTALADRLGLDSTLAAHLDAAASGAKVR